MPINWRPSMAVGDPMIDGDHQHLIGLINAVEETLGTEGDNARLYDTLDQLAVYAKEHFEREENLMRYLSYNGVVQHRQAHRTLREQLGRIRAAIEAAKGEQALPAVATQGLITLLRSWLLNHVLKEDMLLKAFLEEVS